jgi:hypothetical protein
MFDDSMLCIGDFWAASEGLDDLIVRIGRMITYQQCNSKSPLNGLAAKWAAQNSQPSADRFPAGHAARSRPGTDPSRAARTILAFRAVRN